MLSFANHSYSCLFPFCSLLHDEAVLSMEQANQLSQTVVNDQTHISIAMQVGFVELGGRTMLQPIINMLRFDGSPAQTVMYHQIWQRDLISLFIRLDQKKSNLSIFCVCVFIVLF